MKQIKLFFKINILFQLSEKTADLERQKGYQKEIGKEGLINMNREIYFMPLGGGQRVGASCYFLRLGNSNILLDAGIGVKEGITFEPDIYSLLTSPFVQSLNQINQIFISHAHTDHVGYLLKLLKAADRSMVYMTEMTALLAEYQLYDKNYRMGGGKSYHEKERLAAKTIFDKVVKVSYMQTLKFGQYQVTFFPAGHIPGAMMILFEYGKRKILYTGDYSISGTSLTGGCILPEQLEIDTIILCGLHAKHPYYRRKEDALYKTIDYIYGLVEKKGISVMCHVQQLSKGIEFLKTLNERNISRVPIDIDDSVMPVIKKMEQLAIPILSENNHSGIKEERIEPHIVLTSKTHQEDFRYEHVRIDFSLHEDFSEMIKFLKRVNPRQAVIVHCAAEYRKGDDSIEQKMMMDGECRTQFLFAEEGEIYGL